MNKARAFLRRDFGIEASYRLNFLLSLFSVFLAAAVFHFLGKVVDPAALGGAGYDYFSFAIVGIAFSSFLRTGLFSFSSALREEQMMGTLEAMLATPVRGAEVVVYSSLWRFLFASLTAAYYCLNDKEWNPAQVQKKLTHPFANDVIFQFLMPWNMTALLATDWDRSDLLADSFNKNLFSDGRHVQTFGDLRQDRPRLLINATDLQSGRRFVFSNEKFDSLNSDLSKYPISYAVAASAAATVITKTTNTWPSSGESVSTNRENATNVRFTEFSIISMPIRTPTKFRFASVRYIPMPKRTAPSTR